MPATTALYLEYEFSSKTKQPLLLRLYVCDLLLPTMHDASASSDDCKVNFHQSNIYNLIRKKYLKPRH